MRIKLAIAFVFTLIVLPAAPAAPMAMSAASMGWLAITETVAGLLLGIGVRLFIMAIQVAGSIAGQSTSLAQVLGGAAVDPLPAMGYILVVGALALAVMTGLHVKAALLVILSYDLFPIGTLPGGASVSEWGTDQIRRAFSLAFTLAAPFVILAVLYNLALGVINKAMPQLMVAFVGAPVITAGGLLILLLASPMILEIWLQAIDGFLANPLEAVP